MTKNEMNKIDRVIITNNPAVEKARSNTEKVVFMDGATPYEVYCAVKELLEKGGRLTRPILKGKTDYYYTACVFFNGETEPTPWNMREIEAALRATQGLVFNENQAHGKLVQLRDRWHNVPERKIG